MRVTSKSVIKVLGSSSFFASSGILTTVVTRFSECSLSTMCNSIRFIESGGLRGSVHCCSSEVFGPGLVELNFVPTRPDFCY